MRENGIMLGLFAETPLHPGTGSTTGVVRLTCAEGKAYGLSHHSGFGHKRGYAGGSGKKMACLRKRWKTNPQSHCFRIFWV